jgi:hypothetical protein
VSIGGARLLVGGVPLSGSDGVGVIGSGNKQPLMLTIKLTSIKELMIRFIVSSYALNDYKILAQSFACRQNQA